MENKEIDQIIANTKFTVCWHPKDAICGNKGGQQVSVSPRGVYMESPDVGFAVFVDAHRSQIRNRELAVKLFDIYLDELK